MNEDLLIPEFLPLSDEVGGTGRRLVLTNLFNYTMPFLRYDQGDIVHPMTGDCPCGSPFCRIAIRRGRTGAVLKLPAGGSVSALRLTSVLLPLTGIGQFRFVLAKDGALVLEVVAGAGFSRTEIDGAIRELQTLLRGIPVHLELVSRILPEPSGKTNQFRIESEL